MTRNSKCLTARLELKACRWCAQQWSLPITAVDDLMGVFHHLVGVYDSEHESLAEQFANADVPEDDDIAYLLDREDSLRSGLHVPAQKPKGVTYGRKVNRSRSRKPRGVY